MSRFLEQDAKDKQEKGTLPEEVFLEQARKRFPCVSFLVGQAASRDELGQPYKTICIGGVKHEGCAFTHIVLTVPSGREDAVDKSITHVWDSWWKSFGEYIPKTGTVYVRQVPEYACWVEYVLETFSSFCPTLVPKQYSQISGRFSFHTQEEPISG